MRRAIHPLPQYAFMVWFSVKAQGQLYLYPQGNIPVAVGRKLILNYILKKFIVKRWCVFSFFPRIGSSGSLL
jgi:hypothetical protein